MSHQIIDNIFKFQNGDVMQICEDGQWTDLGVISDKRAAGVALAKDNFTVMGKPARVVRR